MKKLTARFNFISRLMHFHTFNVTIDCVIEYKIYLYGRKGMNSGEDALLNVVGIEFEQTAWKIEFIFVFS